MAVAACAPRAGETVSIRGGGLAGNNISSVDGKGRILIPQSIRDAANIKADEKVIVEFDSKSRAIIIEPAHEKKLLKLSIALSDSPGSLAHAASALAALGVDLVSTRSHSSRRGEAAVWEVGCNPGVASVQQIKSALAKAGARITGAKRE